MVPRNLNRGMSMILTSLMASELSGFLYTSSLKVSRPEKQVDPKKAAYINVI